jgi:beta-carotene hydroxylase
MSHPVISVAGLSAQDQASFKRLTRAPAVAWPTVALWLLVTGVFIVSDTLAVTGHLPLWAGMLVNGAFGYFGFSVVHDSIHRAISTNTMFNDWLGRLSMPLALPYATMEVFRMNHIRHHRFASGPQDPDLAFQGPWWQLPFRWMFIDVFYGIHLIRHLDKVSRPYLMGSVRNTIISVVLIAVLTWYGYGLPVLMLWFIPSRFILLTLGFSFFWLPHVPHDVSQEQNFTRATTVRLGYERLMNLLLQHQNFHLIHHLYPNTPFYNNGKVWHLIEAELRKQDLAIQHGFAIQPVIYRGAGPTASPLKSSVQRVSHA